MRSAATICTPKSGHPFRFRLNSHDLPLISGSHSKDWPTATSRQQRHAEAFENTGLIVRPHLSWFQTLLVRRGSVMPDIAAQLLLVGAFAGLITLQHGQLRHPTQRESCLTCSEMGANNKLD